MANPPYRRGDRERFASMTVMYGTGVIPRDPEPFFPLPDTQPPPAPKVDPFEILQIKDNNKTSSDSELAALVLKRGAQAYLDKDFELADKCRELAERLSKS